MRHFPSILPVEIVEWQDRPGIQAEVPYNLQHDDLHEEHRRDTDFGDDENVRDMGSFYGAFTWSFVLRK